MNKELVVLVFKKVDKLMDEENASKNSKCVYLSNILLEEYKLNVSERQLTRYFDFFICNKGAEIKTISNPIKTGFSVFLGYESFQRFKEKQRETDKNKTDRRDVNNNIKENITESFKATPELIIKSKSKLLKWVSISFISLVVVISTWLVADLFSNKNYDPKPTIINYNTYNGNLNYYYSKKDNGEIVLYNKQGVVEDVTLKPVTKDVILTSFKQQNIQVTNSDVKRWFKESEFEEKTINTDNDLLQSDVPAQKQKEKKLNLELSSTVHITNNNNLDAVVCSLFKKKYNKTAENYKATGTITYNFKPSSFSSKMVVCNLTFIYEVKLPSTNSIFETNTIRTTASGTSNDNAKNNAIEKIKFN